MNHGAPGSTDPRQPDYRPTLIESPSVLSSLLSGLRLLFAPPSPAAIAVTSLPVALPAAWNDYPRQPASWMNSLMVHALVLTALMLPFIGKHAGDAGPSARRVIPGPLYLPVQLLADLRGGGGGGDRSPLPASKGPIPR